jgi:hypothetical protein
MGQRLFAGERVCTPVVEGLFYSDSAFFDAPLGKLPVDQEFSAELESSCTLFEMNGIPHLTEHFLEVLLPLVKFCCGGTSGKWLPEGQNPDRGSLFRRDREQGETVCYGALSFE